MPKAIKDALIILLISICCVIVTNGALYLYSITPTFWRYIELGGVIVVLLVFLSNSASYISNSKGQRSIAGRPERGIEVQPDINPDMAPNTAGCCGPIILFLIICIIAISFLNIGNFFLKNNLLLSFLLAICLLQFVLRKHIIAKQTWKKIGDPWLKWSGVPALSIGGFGFIATNKDWAEKILKITTSTPYVKTEFLTAIYIINLFILGIAYVLTIIGKSSNGAEDTNTPKGLFLLTFYITWTSTLIFTTLFFDAILLTFHAHLTATATN